MSPEEVGKMSLIVEAPSSRNLRDGQLAFRQFCRRPIESNEAQIFPHTAFMMCLKDTSQISWMNFHCPCHFAQTDWLVEMIPHVAFALCDAW